MQPRPAFFISRDGCRDGQEVGFSDFVLVYRPVKAGPQSRIWHDGRGRVQSCQVEGFAWGDQADYVRGEFLIQGECWDIVWPGQNQVAMDFVTDDGDGVFLG